MKNNKCIGCQGMKPRKADLSYCADCYKCKGCGVDKLLIDKEADIGLYCETCLKDLIAKQIDMFEGLLTHSWEDVAICPRCGHYHKVTFEDYNQSGNYDCELCGNEFYLSVNARYSYETMKVD